MNRSRWTLALFGLFGVAWPTLAGDPALPKGDLRDGLQPSVQPSTLGWQATPFSSVILQDPFTTLNGKESGDGEGGNGKTKGGPAHIRDNGFLVEEAFNQEPGDVQHIFNWVQLWDRTPEARTRDFAWLYTMEIPLGSQKHQFSFTTQMLDAYENPADGPYTRLGGVGDTFLNYRYQLLADDDFLWCAPRFSLIVPTGDKRFGLGTGEVGYQFNLPISRYGEEFDFHFNAGVTYFPGVSFPLSDGSASPRHDLRGYNVGASVFWKPETYLHFFVEALVFANEYIDDLGFRLGPTQALVNPGVRWAVCQLDQCEWVLGVAVPIGLTRDSPDIGVFFYMSVEHNFLKAKNGN